MRITELASLLRDMAEFLDKDARYALPPYNNEAYWKKLEALLDRFKDITK